jgi:toxic protein SymE
MSGITNIIIVSQFRKLKIYQKFRIGRWDNTIVPEIRLEGKWLQALGFEEGKEIKVKQQKNKLTITLAEKRSR